MRTLTLIFLSAIYFNASAQKLPNVQMISVRAPGNVKVDGKPTEWGSMSAKNSNTDILYTIANDDKKLYLIVQCKGRDAILRLVNGGVTFLVQPSGQKSDKGAVGIKFPYMEKGANIGIAYMQEIEHENFDKADANIAANNKKLATQIKWIYTKGLLGTDKAVPVYNDDGIQAACLIDSQQLYTCEMAIDLRLLGLTADSSSKFAYHILINGEPNKYVIAFNPEKMGAVRKDGAPVTEAELQFGKQMVQKEYAAASATSDFWGEYTLAK